MSDKRKVDEPQEGTKVKDESRDHIYYTITPRLVWALSEDVYDLALWMVVKDIAGENGTCILSREDLAALAMMSAGQVTTSRERLLEKKLLRGECKRDPGYPQEVWHLSIPDFWEANVRWARMYPTIRSRVEFKKSQKANKERKPKDCPECGETFSPISRRSKLCPPCEEKSRHRMTTPEVTSSDDGGMTPDDGGMTPDDVKNNVLEKPKEEIKEEELKSLFLKASNTIFSDIRDLSTLRAVTEELDLARYALDGSTFFVSGLPGDRPAYYQDRYKTSFERAFVGLLGAEVSIDFTGGDVIAN